jgi:hypothetical protein
VAENELSVVTKTYDLALWVLPHVSRFPRNHRFTLGDRLESGVLDVLELLVDATCMRQKANTLRAAQLKLHRVRYLVRLAKDLGIFSVRQYEFAATSIAAIATELGGWLRQQTGS